MISKKDVRHIAKLARISLTEKEIEKFQKELSLILDYVEKLKEVDISKVQATFHLIPKVTLEKGMREDVAKKRDIEMLKRLIKAAPETKETYIKVKSVF